MRSASNRSWPTGRAAAAHEVELMSHVDELSSARLVVAMADPTREHVGIDCRPELQRFVDRVDDVMQKIFFIRVVSPSPGVYHPVRCTSGENARAGSSEVTEQ